MSTQYIPYVITPVQTAASTQHPPKYVEWMSMSVMNRTISGLIHNIHMPLSPWYVKASNFNVSSFEDFFDPSVTESTTFESKKNLGTYLVSSSLTTSGLNVGRTSFFIMAMKSIGEKNAHPMMSNTPLPLLPNRKLEFLVNRPLMHSPASFEKLDGMATSEDTIRWNMTYTAATSHLTYQSNNPTLTSNIIIGRGDSFAPNISLVGSEWLCSNAVDMLLLIPPAGYGCILHDDQVAISMFDEHDTMTRGIFNHHTTHAYLAILVEEGSLSLDHFKPDDDMAMESTRTCVQSMK